MNPFNIVIDLAVGGYWGATDGVDFSLMDATTMKIKNVTFCNRYGYSNTNPNMSKADKSSKIKMPKKSKKTKVKKSDRSIFNRD